MNTQEPPQIPQPPQQKVFPDTQSGDYVKIKLINQGSYGCVYKPEITCDGKVGSANYISKIQISKQAVQNEINISEQIKQIPHFESYFAPIINYCPVNIGVIDKSEQEKCNILQPTQQPQQQQPQQQQPQQQQPQQPSQSNSIFNLFSQPSAAPVAAPIPNIISTKMRFAGKSNLEEYMKTLSILPTQIITKKIYSNYAHILIALRELINQKVIHNDLKENNIMYDDINQTPIIIDFGISYSTSSLLPENYGNIFYTENYYPYWCVEIIVLCSIENVIRKSGNSADPITQDKLDPILNSYFGNLSLFMNSYSVMLTEDEMNMFKKNTQAFFYEYVNANKTWDDLFNDLIQPEVYSSWDNYSLAITYLIIAKTMKLNIPSPDTNTNANTDASASMLALWKSIVSATPGSRITPEKTLEILSNITVQA